MSSPFEQALQRLKGGESLDSLVLSLRSPSDVSTRRGAAAVRSFDRETFDVFNASKADVDFDSFVKQRLVEAVPGDREAFRVRDSDREALLDGFVGSSEWHALNGRLATFFHGRTPSGSADELFHLAALGSEKEDATSRLFVQLFDEADSKFDLSQCAELLDVINDPSHRFSDAFNQTIKQRRCRLRARQMWSQEFFRTTPYHERQFLADGLERLLNGDPRWILHVYAGGGMGKTMFVRWAIARYLVPRGVPCAKLDFDFEQPGWLSQRPWRLALKIARQLNEQMPDAPFTEMVKEYGDAEAEEDRATNDQAQRFERSRSYDDKYNDEAFNRFMWSLAEARSETPPVIVWDTLEKVSLYYPQDLNALVQRFAVVRSQYPRLRMLLTGRYNLGDEQNLPGFGPRFGTETLTLAVRPFSADEGREYLTKRRGLPADARVDAIVDRSTGVPFKLSLFATIVQDDPSLDEKAIREMPNVNVEFLIKRVVDQINEPMAQWVLRHGVVPRQLTRTFLRDVMLPRLQEIQRGSSTLDSGQDNLPDRLHNPDRFRRGLLAEPTDTIDVDGLWRTLNRYAADYSWISQSKDWPDTLVFHADVVNAMRFLLQEHEIFQHLHEDAIRYYDAKAASDEANWARWTREALYHRFQRGGPEAVAAWKKALEQAAVRGSARREVAEEILGSEYVDETGTSRQRKDGSAMVPVDLLVSANYEAARAGVEEALLRQLSSTDRLWLMADRRMREAVRIQRTLAAPVVPEGAIGIVSARIELPRNPERARQLLEEVRKDVTPDIASEFEELYGDTLSTKDVRSAGAHYRAALDLLPGNPLRRGQAVGIGLKIAQSASSAGDYAQAIEARERAFAVAEGTVFGTTIGGARVEVAASLLAAGRIDDAMRACGDGENIVSDVDRARLGGIGGHIRLLAGDPLSAWTYARSRFPRAFNSNIQAFRTFEDAEGLELKADVHAALFEYEDAIAALRDARHAWDVVRFPNRSFDCVLRSVSLLIRETQQAALAGQMMSEAERTAASLGADAELRFRTLEAERRAVADRASGVAVLDSVLDAPNLVTAREPRVGVDAAALAIAMGHRVGDATSLLSAILEQVTPPAARLGMLAPPDHPQNLDDKLSALRSVLHPAIDDALDENKPANAWTIAALSALCWISETTDAGKRIERARERLLEDSSLFRVLALREIAGRLGVDRSANIFEQSLTTRFLEEFQEHPRVCGALLLTETESRAKRDKRQPSRDTLAKIQEYLGDPAKLTSTLRGRLKLLTDSVLTPLISIPLTHSAGVAEESLPAPKKAETPTVTIAFGTRNDEAVITDSNQPVSDRPIAGWFSALTGSTAESFTSRGVATPAPLASRLARDSQVGHDIFQLLCDERVVEARSEPAGIRIQTSHSLYGAIPWELARTRDRLLIKHPNVRCLYRSAPADISFRPGVLTPSRPRSKSVVIVRRSYRSQLSEVRGSAFAGFDVEQLYRQAGWKVTVLEDPTASWIKSTLLTTHADVLHINAHVAEASRLGGLYLDIGREIEQFTESSEVPEGARRGEGIPVADLVETLHPRPDPAPLLVLDPPSIPIDTEAARQLLLRNAFAADAFRLGAIPIIFATGLLRGDDYRRVASELIFGLDRGQSVHDVCTAMRVVQATDPGAIEYPVTTALFTQDPENRPFSAAHAS